MNWRDGSRMRVGRQERKSNQDGWTHTYASHREHQQFCKEKKPWKLKQIEAWEQNDGADEMIPLNDPLLLQRHGFPYTVKAQMCFLILLLLVGAED